MNLQFLWRENYVGYLWASNVTANAYFLHDGILLYENGILSAYTTKEELRVVRTATKRFSNDPKAILKLAEKFQGIRDDIKNLKSLYTKRGLKNYTDKELYKNFILLIDSLKKYIDTYRWTEPHYIEYLEQMAFEAAGKKSWDEKTAQKMVSRLLSSGSKKLYRQFNLDADTIKLFDLLNAVAKMRFEAKRIYAPLAVMSENILRETARRTYFAVSQLSNFSLEELKNLLLKEKQPDIEIVNRRQKTYAIKIDVESKTKVSDFSDQEIKN